MPIISSFPSGGDVDPGELIQDGLQLDINPDTDNITVDGSGYITSYVLNGISCDDPQDVKCGDSVSWLTSGTDYFTITDDNNIYHYPGTSTNRTIRYTASEAYADCEITYQIKLSGTGTLTGSTFLRQTDHGTTSYNGYRLTLSSTALTLSSASSGSLTTLGTKALTLSSGTWYSIRFKIVGTAIKAKIWLSGSSEPPSWDIEVTNSTYSAGSIAMYGSNANVYAYFSNLQIYLSSQVSGAATLESDSTILNGEKRIVASDSISVLFPTTLGLSEIAARTVFMLYRLREDGYRYNASFFRAVGLSLKFGVVGEDTETSDGKNVISIFGRAGTTSYAANQYDISISREDRFELVCAKAADNSTGITGYTYGIQEITNRSKQWAEVDFTTLAVPTGMELARLLYYNRVLSDEELLSVHQYLAYTYGTKYYIGPAFFHI